jgi:hypothetical protein
LSAVLLGATANAESFLLKLRTKTSNAPEAGTDDHVYFAVHYLVRDESKPNVETAKARLRLDDTRKNDRQTGAVDTYSLSFEFPPAMIRKVEIGMEGGRNAWLLERFDYAIVHQGKTSRPTVIPVNRWLSGEVIDRSLKGKALTSPYYVFEVKPPVFDVK